MGRFIEVEDQDLDTIISLIRAAGADLTAKSDEIHFDEELEEPLYHVARTLLLYPRLGLRTTTPKMAMIQVFDILSRWVEDPSLMPTEVQR